jgi:hypothetical protein
MYLNDIDSKIILKRHEVFWRREILDRVCISVVVSLNRVAVPEATSAGRRRRGQLSTLDGMKADRQTNSGQ